MTRNQNQIRLCWPICLVLLGRCASLVIPSRGFQHRIPNSFSLELSRVFTSKLHSTSPMSYEELSNEPLVEQQKSTVIDNKLSSSFIGNTESTAICIPLINQIFTNQVLLLLLASCTTVMASFFGDTPFEISSIHWNGVQEFHSLFDWHPSSFRIATGVLSAIPLIAMEQFIAKTDNRDASRVNFDTTNMVISLFGRRQSESELISSAPFKVILFSALIAISSGLSEEIIFRGYIPTALSTFTNSLPLALFLQAGLFASGHKSKNTRQGENEFFPWSLEFINGLWYGSVYLMSGGDILPCVIAHVLNDMHIIYSTWHRVNNQMDYTQDKTIQCMTEGESNVEDRLQTRTGITLNSETILFARQFFYAFDVDHTGSLSLHDCQRAVSYAFMNDNIAPDTNVVRDLFNQAQEERHDNDGSETSLDRLNFSEFLHLLFVLRSNTRGVPLI